MTRRNGKSRTGIYAVSAAAAIVLAVGFTLGLEVHERGAANGCAEGRIAGAAVGGPFELVDGNGMTVTDRDVIRQPSLVYFGYTFCPDVCPFDVARNAAAVDILDERGIDAAPVFVSVDPERDTPDVVAEFAEAYHPKMIGLTGSPEQVKAAADAYRVYFKKRNSGGVNYLVDHTTFTYLIFPGNRLADYFRRDATAEEVAARAACFAESG